MDLDQADGRLAQPHKGSYSPGDLGGSRLESARFRLATLSFQQHANHAAEPF